MTTTPLLRVENLNVSFANSGRSRTSKDELKPVVKDISFTLDRGRCIALVGESGSGKSVTARSLVGLTGEGAVVNADALEFEGAELQGRPDSWWQDIRGSRIGFVLQDALVSLDPLRPVGKEISEAFTLHAGTRGVDVPERSARDDAVTNLLAEVGVPEPEIRARQRPDELSGGLRQRALIASAIALNPSLVIADEPTTALDVTVQAQVLDVLETMISAGTSVILISHDLAVVARLADEVLVMNGGRVVESGPTEELLRAPQHPYTRQLINAVPSERTKGGRLTTPARSHRSASSLFPPHEANPDSVHSETSGPVLDVQNVSKSYRGPDRQYRRVVKDISFHLNRGETVGIVGESGSGKSTLARIALALVKPDSGHAYFNGERWSDASEPRQRAIRRKISVVFQDPLSSFDPRWKVSRILTDAIHLGDPRYASKPRDRAVELLEIVGLSSDHLDVWPLHLSGGQRQRVAIARALATDPEIIVLDEAVSALDVSIQAQILDLLSDLQDQLNVSYLFISHDLGVIHHMSDRVLVIQDGNLVEHGPADTVFNAPQHPYTQQLLESLPRLDAARTPDTIAS
ncbi:MAG: dipeptide ABC transporter ATP-binding protein [Mycobacteriaceae bacterium]|uniref:dipeptide ABC transporter ATP-binding protein n=1 Tax=Corynebacterium sp. TaxID=1720 RepID=UPI003F96B751